jgi:acetylornithine/succinyldiaminopimelate/putrescine aminotransferase
MAAARATLEVLEAEDAPRRAQEAGARLTQALEEIPGVIAVRGRGLLLAAVLDRDVAPSVVRAALDAGLIINAPRPDVLRFAPPLLVTEAEIDRAATIVGQVMADLAAETEARR